MTSPHDFVQPEGLARARGYSHAVGAGPGRTVWVAGQIATDEMGTVVGETFSEQFDQAMGNLVIALRAAGAEPDHVVSMQVFATDVDAYLAAAGTDLGPIWQRHMGRHYPAMALLGVSALVDPAAMVEIMATAVIPDL